MPARMLVDIIVTSYNYGRFLQCAIDSCLRQTYAPTEVVVVDDGSSDDSRDIISSYGSSVVPVFKSNGGHASAINAGFAACRGDIVCLLDSDDVCEPARTERVAAAWKEQPGAYLAYHQLQTIDADGTRIGRPWPAETWNGDISGRIKRSGGWWPRPPTSGLCFARSYLERVLPMPTGARVWADAYLAPPAAMARPVIGVREQLGLYRLHGENTLSTLFPEVKSREGRREIARRKVDQFLMEERLFEDCLAGLFESPPTISLDQYPEFQRVRRAAGDPVSLLGVLSIIARSPAIPRGMKLREMARVVLRG
jgi:glycosyltransferase involved in cell wall biosynthesis